MRLLRRDPASPNPQPDAQLDDDDFPTEIKTVGNLTGSEIAAGLSRRIREGLSQAPSVVIDAREQENLSAAQIAEAMRRAILGITLSPVKQIEFSESIRVNPSC